MLDDWRTPIMSFACSCWKSRKSLIGNQGRWWEKSSQGSGLFWRWRHMGMFLLVIENMSSWLWHSGPLTYFLPGLFSSLLFLVPILQPCLVRQAPQHNKTIHTSLFLSHIVWRWFIYFWLYLTYCNPYLTDWWENYVMCMNNRITQPYFLPLSFFSIVIKCVIFYL